MATILRTVIVSALSVFVSIPASAVSVQTRADALVRTGASIVDRETDTSGPTGNVSATATGTTSSGIPYQGSASAFLDATDFGTLRISGSAHMTGSGQASALSQIEVTDSILFSDTSLTGQLGIWHVSLFVGGSMSDTNNATSTVQSRWNVNVATSSVGGGGFVSHFTQGAFLFDGGNAVASQCSLNGVASADYGDCTGLFTLDIPFIFGTEFNLILGFDASAQAATQAAGHVGDSEYDLANSLLWGGTSSITFGNATVTNYGFASDSGFDWQASSIPTTPVPEPTTLALFCLGLATLLRRTSLRPMSG